MINELTKDYIGKECIITLADTNNTEIKGIIIHVENNWIKIKNINKTRIINNSFIRDVSIATELNNSLQEEKTINYIKEHEDVFHNNNNKNKNINSTKNAVVLTHGEYWYRAYNDSAYVLSFLTDYKLYEDTQTKQPTVGFPIVSISNVLNLLQKNKINYFLKYENIYKDFGDENNFQRFLHKDLPFSYVKSNQTISKLPKGKFIVQYEGEKEEEFIIGNNITENAELTKQVINSNVGEIIKINNYNIKIIEKNIEY